MDPLSRCSRNPVCPAHFHHHPRSSLHAAPPNAAVTLLCAVIRGSRINCSTRRVPTAADALACACSKNRVSIVQRVVFCIHVGRCYCLPSCIVCASQYTVEVPYKSWASGTSVPTLTSGISMQLKVQGGSSATLALSAAASMDPGVCACGSTQHPSACMSLLLHG